MTAITHDAPFASYRRDLYRESALPWAAFARPCEVMGEGLLLSQALATALILSVAQTLVRNQIGTLGRRFGE